MLFYSIIRKNGLRRIIKYYLEKMLRALLWIRVAVTVAGPAGAGAGFYLRLSERAHALHYESYKQWSIYYNQINDWPYVMC